MTRLKQIRRHLHLSQQQMADVLHVSRRTYGLYERGERELNDRMLARFSSRLQLTPEQLLSGDEPVPVRPESREEEQLLSLYRCLDASGKEYIRGALVREQSLAELYRRRRPRGT